MERVGQTYNLYLYQLHTNIRLGIDFKFIDRDLSG